MRRLLSAVATLALISGEAQASIGTTVAIMSSTGSSGQTSKGTALGTACPAGSLVTIFANIVAGATPSPSASDTPGNTYTLVATTNGASGEVKAIFYAVNSRALTASNFITVTFGTTLTGNSRIVAVCTPGIVSFDNQTAWASGAGTTASTATAALASNVNGELLMSFSDEDTANYAWTVDTAHGWTRAYEAVSGGRTGIDTQILAAGTTGVVTDAPTMSTSQNWEVTTLAFKATPPPPPSTCVLGGLSRLGVGC